MFTPNYNLSISYIKKMQLIKALIQYRNNRNKIKYIKKMQPIKVQSTL